MVQVRPQAPSPSSTPDVTAERETYTLWMKSLVHKNGCTVYDSNGEIVYRVDNYDRKCRSKVYLMDLQGNVLYILRRKKIKAFGCWDGYGWNNEDNIRNEKPFFKVKKYRTCFVGDCACQVTVGGDKYWMERVASKTAFRIVDIKGNTVAEVKRKHSSEGVALGDDVFTMVVEPRVDRSFIMALVTVYGLINHKL